MSKLRFPIIFVCCITTCVAAAQNDDVYLAVRRNCDLEDTQPIQGRPGKKGAVGSQGAKGDKGNHGFKGEAGVCNASEVLKLTNQVNNLTEQLTNSRQKIKILETSIDILDQKMLKLTLIVPILPSPGWYTPWNGYQYQLTTTKRSWQGSRAACQAMDGDLAVRGMMDYNTLRLIGQALIQDSFTWIGLNDILREGRFIWLDGTISTSSNTPWKSGQPDDSGGEDCGGIWTPNAYRLNDAPCGEMYFGLCEKQLV